MNHAGSYAGTVHYLKACAALGGAAAKADGAAVVAKMKSMPTEDDCFGSQRIREDGRVLLPAHLFEVKTPAESRGPWDYYKPIAVTSGEDAAPPLATEGCKLVHS
jgi:branched-chain amino acid transport system substrate-binding protein